MSIPNDSSNNRLEMLTLDKLERFMLYSRKTLANNMAFDTAWEIWLEQLILVRSSAPGKTISLNFLIFIC